MPPNGRPSGTTGYADMFRLDGRDALVVGAGSGIGAEIARGLAAFGASVVCADARLEGATASALLLDLLDPASSVAAVLAIPVPHVLVTTPAINVRKRIVDYADD